MKINWDATKAAFGSFGGYVDDCKSTDYDTDGGFWDGVGDWWGGKIYIFFFLMKTVLTFKTITINYFSPTKLQEKILITAL